MLDFIDYSGLTDRELTETLINRMDMIVAIQLAVVAIAVATLFVYIIYRAIMRFS
jgi:hypothetical protein